MLVDEFDSLMASLEPFWALDAAELRRRTVQVGLQPSFALVHVEAGKEGGTFWDANEDEELIKPFGVERARGFERMIRPFVGRPGITNMVFAINELAEPRVLVPWEEKQLLNQALANGTSEPPGLILQLVATGANISRKQPSICDSLRICQEERRHSFRSPSGRVMARPGMYSSEPVHRLQRRARFSRA